MRQLEKTERQHVLFHFDRICAEMYRAQHLMDVRGVGQRKRYERMAQHLEEAWLHLTAARASLAGLADKQPPD